MENKVKAQQREVHKLETMEHLEDLENMKRQEYLDKQERER